MRVLIAPDRFTGTLTATQAAEAIGAGWSQGAPHDEVRTLPLSDGGPGFLDVVGGARDATPVAVTVSDPLGRDVPAVILLDGDPDGAAGRTAYVESAQACGLHLLAADERNPALTSTYGVGQLLAAAREEGARRIVVGLGGSGTNDGGAGMLAALGAGAPEHLARGGLALRDAPDDALAGLAEVRRRFHGVDIVLASDADNPLLGFEGASAVFGPRKGADPGQVQALEAALGRLTDIVVRSGALGTDLISDTAVRLERVPGAGAAGGLGYGLLLLGGAPVSGVEEALRAVRLEDHLAASDLVVTGEGRLSWSSLRGTVVAGVARASEARALPVVVLAGEVLVGRRETMGLGVSGCYAVAETPEQVEAALLDPVGTLRARAARVARTWSPAR